MEYCGKSLDGFEYAFSSLLRANGVDVERLPSLDCLSFQRKRKRQGLVPSRGGVAVLCADVGCKPGLHGYAGAAKRTRCFSKCLSGLDIGRRSALSWTESHCKEYFLQWDTSFFSVQKDSGRRTHDL